ncbi:MAG TPA: hypothetical protein PLE54_09775 [Burkholderiaceae bacterium]|nr:hypothetical protein [Burkholderiaceae bacterium]HQR70879.1 hypothetical protein [Burkholderiaceae bacterium]
MDDATRYRPGRGCPPAYGYSPRAFARDAEFSTEVLYVIGGLYGNLPALVEIERMAALEQVPARLVFNGDFHWFDADAAACAAVDRAVMRHVALRGNVETEAASDVEANGCGCAYPESVPDEDVERSNRILRRLRGALRAAERELPGLRSRLAALPMHRVAAVGDARIGIVHGDAWALAGWRFAHDALHGGDDSALVRAFGQAAVDVFASTHTCLPALKLVATAAGECAVVNNGAAGMPNFRGNRSGLITRIATHPVPAALASARRYGTDVAGVYVDALDVRFDATAWDREFRRLWPGGSAAEMSYAHRMAHGPDYTVDDALGRIARAACAAAAA